MACRQAMDMKATLARHGTKAIRKFGNLEGKLPYRECVPMAELDIVVEANGPEEDGFWLSKAEGIDCMFVDLWPMDAADACTACKPFLKQRDVGLPLRFCMNIRTESNPPDWRLGEGDASRNRMLLKSHSADAHIHVGHKQYTPHMCFTMQHLRSLSWHACPLAWPSCEGVRRQDSWDNLELYLHWITMYVIVLGWLTLNASWYHQWDCSYFPWSDQGIWSTGHRPAVQRVSMI